MAGSPLGGAPRASDNDIYSVLALVATLFVLTATIYIGYKSMALCGTLIPAGGS
jgi:hypothetical protein